MPRNTNLDDLISATHPAMCRHCRLLSMDVQIRRARLTLAGLEARRDRLHNEIESDLAAFDRAVEAAVAAAGRPPRDDETEAEDAERFDGLS